MSDKSGGGGDRLFTKVFEAESVITPHAWAEMEKIVVGMGAQARYVLEKFRYIAVENNITKEEIESLKSRLERVITNRTGTDMVTSEVIKFVLEILRLVDYQNQSSLEQKAVAISNRIGSGGRRQTFGQKLSLIVTLIIESRK